MKLATLTSTGVSGSLTVNDALFGAAVNHVLVAQAIRVYLACARQGTAKTKTRAEINRTHKKWFKQKGTGNARHGARTPNIFVGGGVSHGPNGEQNWMLALNQTMKQGALVSALSAQAAQTLVAEIPTDGKQARTLLANDQKTLVILDEANQAIIRGIRNVASILVTTADRVTALDVMGADRIVVTEAAIARLEARLLDEKKPVAKAKVSPVDPAVAAIVEKPAKKTTASSKKAEVKSAKKTVTKKVSPKA